MFQKIFNPDNALMITLAQIGDCIFLSLFWLLCSFPLVTLGASTAALYDSTVRAFRKGEKHSWARYIKVFRDHIRVGILPTVVFLAFLFWEDGCSSWSGMPPWPVRSPG